jgi:plastocyanin
MIRGRAACAAAFSMAVMLGGATAEAATKTVIAGPAVAQRPAGFPLDGDTNRFYRKVVTIHAGDRVTWSFRGFHTVMFPGRGGTPPHLLTQDPGHPVSGATDATGAPFWFNGRPQVMFNPFAFIPTGGGDFDGGQPAASGAPRGQGAFEPYTLRFTKPGTYRYLCTIHSGNAPMAGVVKVVPKGRRIPTARDDRRVAKAEFERVVARLKADGRRPAPASSVVKLGRDTAGTSLLRFFPRTRRLHEGDVVTFSMARRTNEIHTAAFGPPDVVEALAFRPLDPAAPAGAAAPTLLSPIASYPSDPPQSGPAIHTGTQHGNGFMNTGLLDRDPASAPPPSARVRFTRAGTYGYICLVHPSMKGRVVVTP